MDWDDVRHFLALARTSSVRAAGSTLGVSHTTVARRVDALETRLGVKLFDRHRDGYLLTVAGREMVCGAQRVEREMVALERGLVGQDARLEGPVRVTCTDTFLASLLLRGLADLCAQHPGIEIDLDAEPKYADMSKREADVAVRAFLPQGSPPEHLIGRRLVPITLCNYGACTGSRTESRTPDSAGARWLGGVSRKTAALLVASSSHPDLPIWGSFESMALLVEAAVAGLGLVMLPTYVGDVEPRLQRLAEPDVRHVADFWLLSHADLRDNARFRATRANIAATLNEHMSLFCGEANGRRETVPLRHEHAPSPAESGQ